MLGRLAAIAAAAAADDDTAADVVSEVISRD